MTPQERDVLLPLLDKLRQTRLPNKDDEADRYIHETVQEQPDLAYILTQTVLMQDYALHAAQDRISALQAQVQQGQTQQPQPSSGGFLGGLFGGGASHAAQPQAQPQTSPWGSVQAQRPSYGPQIATAMQPGAGQPSFLRSAATTAAGIAGGALLFQGLEGLMGGHGGFGGGGFGGGGFLGGGGGGFAQPEVVENVTNNYYDQPVPDDQVGVQGGDSDDDQADQANFDDSSSGGDDSFNI